MKHVIASLLTSPWLFSAGAVLLSGAFIVFAKRSSKTAKSIFEKTLNEDIVSNLATEVALPAKDLFDAARAALEGREGALATIPNLLRIEYGIVKTGKGKTRRTVAIAFRNGTTIILKKTAREIPWDDLPVEVRGEFIRSNKEALFYSLYSSQNSEVPNVATR